MIKKFLQILWPNIQMYIIALDERKYLHEKWHNSHRLLTISLLDYLPAFRSLMWAVATLTVRRFLIFFPVVFLNLFLSIIKWACNTMIRYRRSNKGLHLCHHFFFFFSPCKVTFLPILVTDNSVAVSTDLKKAASRSIWWQKTLCAVEQVCITQFWLCLFRRRYVTVVRSNYYLRYAKLKTKNFTKHTKAESNTVTISPYQISTQAGWHKERSVGFWVYSDLNRKIRKLQY